MAEDEQPKSLLHVLGVAVVALVGGMARFADDCARVGAHAGGSMDDLARVAGEGDDLARLAGEGDDLARVAGHGDDVSHLRPELETVAAQGSDAGHGSGAFDTLADAKDLTELGLDVQDLVGSGSDASDAPDPSLVATPHLVAARRANPPATGRVEPLVLLVEDSDRARVERLVRGCTTPEHSCVVLACPPGRARCVESWVTTFEKDKSDLIGHPESVGPTFGMEAVGAERGGTMVWSAAMSPTGPSVYELTPS